MESLPIEWSLLQLKRVNNSGIINSTRLHFNVVGLTDYKVLMLENLVMNFNSVNIYICHS